MPIFIDELVFRGEVVASAPGGASDRPGAAIGEAGGDRQALVTEVTEAVIDHLERILERIGER